MIPCRWLKSIPKSDCRVSNVTHFGAFVDVGVGKVFQCPTSPVIYSLTLRMVWSTRARWEDQEGNSRCANKPVSEKSDFMFDNRCLSQVGQRVEVKVLNIDIAKGRIGLELVKLLWTLNKHIIFTTSLLANTAFICCLLNVLFHHVSLVTKTPAPSSQKIVTR